MPGWNLRLPVPGAEPAQLKEEMEHGSTAPSLSPRALLKASVIKPICDPVRPAQIFISNRLGSEQTLQRQHWVGQDPPAPRSCRAEGQEPPQAVEMGAEPRPAPPKPPKSPGKEQPQVGRVSYNSQLNLCNPSFQPREQAQ